MRKTQLSVLSAAAIIGFGVILAASPAADASPRFTVDNQSDKTIKIVIFNGDDSECRTPAKTKTMSPGKTNTFGCEGNGKGRCKIYPKKDGHYFCEDMMNTCGNDALKVPDKSTFKITDKNGNFSCQLN